MKSQVTHKETFTTHETNRVSASRIYKDLPQPVQNKNGQEISKPQEKSTVTPYKLHLRLEQSFWRPTRQYLINAHSQQSHKLCSKETGKILAQVYLSLGKRIFHAPLFIMQMQENEKYFKCLKGMHK